MITLLSASQDPIPSTIMRGRKFHDGNFLISNQRLRLPWKSTLMPSQHFKLQIMQLCFESLIRNEATTTVLLLKPDLIINPTTQT
jgi:hypothetical protein